MTDSNRPEGPQPRKLRQQRRESAVQSDLAYVLERQREMADRAEREKRYRPGFKVEPPTKEGEPDGDG